MNEAHKRGDVAQKAFAALVDEMTRSLKRGSDFEGLTDMACEITKEKRGGTLLSETL